MKIEPIIPIWLMAVLCVGLLFLRRREKIAYIRQIIAIVLVFLINLRIMVPSASVPVDKRTLNTYVLFVVDDTISMLAQDYDGDTERLTAVKKDCAHIIDTLEGAKFGVISFNNNANLIAPYTDNSEYANSVIDSLYPLDSLYAKGTSMNVCIDVMVDTLKRAKDKADGSVAVFFISDGEITNEESLQSFREAAKYVDCGAVLGYGTEKGGNMYVQSFISDEKELLEDTSKYPIKPAVSRIDENNLKKIARDMGVAYINMNDGKELESNLEQIIDISEKEDHNENVNGYADIYYIFAVLFAGVMIWEFVCTGRKLYGLAGDRGMKKASDDEQ